MYIHIPNLGCDVPAFYISHLLTNFHPHIEFIVKQWVMNSPGVKA